VLSKQLLLLQSYASTGQLAAKTAAAEHFRNDATCHGAAPGCSAIVPATAEMPLLLLLPQSLHGYCDTVALVLLPRAAAAAHAAASPSAQQQHTCAAHKQGCWCWCCCCCCAAAAVIHQLLVLVKPKSQPVACCWCAIPAVAAVPAPLQLHLTSRLRKSPQAAAHLLCTPAGMMLQLLLLVF
jgi:hypothetical protein